MNKQPWQLRLMLSAGLLLATLPLLFKEYLVWMPDAIRGIIEGFGVGLEFCALILMRRRGRCKSNEDISFLK